MREDRWRTIDAIGFELRGEAERFVAAEAGPIARFADAYSRRRVRV
jgi:hypothetical protein